MELVGQGMRQKEDKTKDRRNIGDGLVWSSPTNVGRKRKKKKRKSQQGKESKSDRLD
jgi:hypothetical protein